MTVTYGSVLQSALQLPAEQRSSIATRLIQSVDDSAPSLSPAWLDEIDRRIARAESGDGTSVPHEQVMSDVRSLLASHTRKPA